MTLYSRKPVRKCHACLLNLGDHCWLYAYPRGQWHGKKRCAAFDDKKIHAEFRLWQKASDVKTRKELRQEIFRARNKPVVRRTPRNR